MCRRSILFGVSLAAFGAGMILAVLIQQGVLSVILALTLICGGICLIKRR